MSYGHWIFWTILIAVPLIIVAWSQYKSRRKAK